MHASLEGIPDLWKEAYRLVSQVPEGMVTTYGEVARALGDPVAARFVGLAMSIRPDMTDVPHARVVRSDGSLGESDGPRRISEKTQLLKREGIVVRNGRVVDLDGHRFIDFQSTKPLALLKRRQRTLKAQVRLPSHRLKFDKVAGADVSYSSDRAFASLVVFDAKTGDEVARHQSVSETPFPYIPTYLAFRELPIIASLARLLEDGTVLMYDGNGILHPERFGIASHAGIAFSVSTIGVAKKLLCGEVGETVTEGVAAVSVEGEVRGYARSCGRGAPVFVSPGHGVSAEQALSIVNEFTRHRLPEPIRIAHQSATNARRLAINK